MSIFTVESQPVEVCPCTLGHEFDGLVTVEDGLRKPTTAAKESCSGQECLSEWRQRVESNTGWDNYTE